MSVEEPQAEQNSAESVNAIIDDIILLSEVCVCVLFVLNSVIILGNSSARAVDDVWIGSCYCFFAAHVNVRIYVFSIAIFTSAASNRIKYVVGVWWKRRFENAWYFLRFLCSWLYVFVFFFWKMKAEMIDIFCETRICKQKMVTKRENV